jgi:stringent starvation protein B
MTPNRPYLIRAFYEWIADNHCTPYLAVDATLPGVKVPMQYVKDGQIVLNINASAVGNLQLGNDLISFNARFGGAPHAIRIPIYAVLSIFARETAAGIEFEQDMPVAPLMDEQDAAPSPLRPVVLSAVTSATDTMLASEDVAPNPDSASASTQAGLTGLTENTAMADATTTAVDATEATTVDASAHSEQTKPKRGAHLTVIK